MKKLIVCVLLAGSALWYLIFQFPIFFALVTIWFTCLVVLKNTILKSWF